MAGRLKNLRKSRGLSQKAFADSLSLPLRTYQSYESGATTLKAGALKSMALLGINIDWLLTGKGDMEQPDADTTAKLVVLIRYWEASSKAAVAHLDIARAAVIEKYGEEEAEEIFAVTPGFNVSNIQFDHSVDKDTISIGEKVVKKSND